MPNGHKICLPDGQKIDHMDIKYTSIFRCKDPPKFTQIGIFVFKNRPSGNPAAYRHNPLICVRVETSFAAMQCHAMPCNAMQCHAMLCHAIQTIQRIQKQKHKKTTKRFGSILGQ
jgi:hypothetical protein